MSDPNMLAMIQRAQGAMASLRKRFPDLFGNISLETITEYSCLGTAMSRSELAKKEGAICKDHIAGLICGEEGKALVQVSEPMPYFGGVEPKTYMSLRSYFGDYTMQKRNASIHQIVILGAGIDTRAFRIPEVAGCHVIEVDGSKLIQDFKKRRIEALQLPLIAKKRDVLVMNLADSAWPEKLLELGFNPKEPTFWLLEGFMAYLTPAQNQVLLTKLDELSAPQSELFCDMCGGDQFYQDSTPSGERIRSYGEDNELLKALPWSTEILLRRTRDLEYSGSLWNASQFQDYVVKEQKDAIFGPFFYAWLKKSVGESP